MPHRPTPIRTSPAVRRTTWWALALIAASFGLLTATSSPAYAVTPVASEPSARSQLADQPGSVTLAFDRDVDPGVAKIVVSGPDGRNVTSGPLIVEGTNVTSQLQAGIERGTYTVHYRIDRADGEPEGGAFQFSYGDGTFTPPPDASWSGAAAEPAVLRGTNPNTSDEPEPPADAPVPTPGIEVTEEGATSTPDEPATGPAASVPAPPGPTDETESLPASTATAVPAAPADGGVAGPWLIVTVLAVAAAVGGGLGLWRSRRRGAAE